MSQAMLNSIALLVLGSVVAAFWTWFWRGRTATVEKLVREKAAVTALADKLAAQHKELEEKVNVLTNQLGLVSQVVTPINQAMQALLIRELTHYHTPELDALMAKLPPEGTLTLEEEQRIGVLLKEREQDLDDSVSESEREAALILPYIIKRVRAEAAAIVESTPQLKIVAVPPDTGQSDLQSPAAAVNGKKADERGAK